MSKKSILESQDKINDLHLTLWQSCYWRYGTQHPREDKTCPQCSSKRKKVANASHMNGFTDLSVKTLYENSL